MKKPSFLSSPSGAAPSRAAHSFVELIVVMALLLTLSDAFYRFFMSVGRTQKGLSQQLMLQMDSRKALDQVISRIQEGSEVVRPFIGETKTFLVLKNIVNQMTMVYLEPNNKASQELKKPIYRLVAYTNDYSGSFQKQNKKTMIDMVKRMTFTSLSPNSIQINAMIVNEKGEYQFITHVGLMNLGGLDK